MRWFSLPVRVAAGITATAVEQTRKLPGHLVGLPITVTSQVLQLSMRLQQQVTEFAIKGDEALGWLHKPQAQPEWATFDEDREPATKRDESAGDSESGADRTEQVPGTGRPATRVLPGYDQMSIHQLRGKLRRLSESDLVDLLEYERGHGQRREFLRMLSRRLDTVRAQ
ncbi:lipid droplet-associated protein [Haloactinomyces albus]|uniref:Lipid droplet-associated protein n=1 Tax=Haloactinomyces albus TaxID=1352928 RepID=A0AAE3ZGX4_9ACTN|nr:lipid droplet-associated protein [Haloactinomyces albus]MDR7302744.1 hypothetical protein [Haloactinomyces albus]